MDIPYQGEDDRAAMTGESTSPISPPGAEPREATLAARLAAAAETEAPELVRTEHLTADGKALYTNRLILEASPYLRQHAHNPVDWYPWGEEAFAAARQFNRPVLLSIGYATCHWCHVMEEESFEDVEIARYLNENYIAIKVDREERPDIDAVYMACVQAWTGQGGWPMTVWLDADKRPYYGGTYFPARDGDRGAHLGFLTLLAELRRIHGSDRRRLEMAARGIVDEVRTRLDRSAAGDAPTAQMLHKAMHYYAQAFDPDEGGIGGAPKFPSSLPTRFLLRYARRFDGPALAMAELTLTKMARGGIYDHVGGGFHRYSVDDQWLVPHFEKMLYDNALLATAYLEAWQATGKQEFADTARETLDYVLREMTSPEGGFYSATDADSPVPERGGEREEGYFFTWTPAELEEVLGGDDAKIAAEFFNVTPGGNFEGRSILHTSRPASEVERLGTIKTALYEARSKRPKPLCDDKLIAGWNGLMISALARGAAVLGDKRYLTAATRAALCLITDLTVGGRLRRCYKGGPSKVMGFLEDYAFVIQGLLDLYESSFDLAMLKHAIRLEGEAAALFEDLTGGAFYMTASANDGHEDLLAREKPGYDGAVPSGNSVMALNLLRLWTLTGQEPYRDRAERTMRAFADLLTRHPAAISEMLLAVDFYLDLPRQIIIAAKEDLREAAPFLQALASRFLPNKVVAVTTAAEHAKAQAIMPLFHDRSPVDGKATAFVCTGNTCKLPTNDVQIFSDQVAT